MFKTDDSANIIGQAPLQSDSETYQVSLKAVYDGYTDIDGLAEAPIEFNISTLTSTPFYLLTHPLSNDFCGRFQFWRSFSLVLRTVFSVLRPLPWRF
jgi:hypothetical protein